MIETTRPDDFDAASIECPHLHDALRDLDEIAEEARDERRQIPSDVAVDNARRILRAMHRVSKQRIAVYPMPGGKVAIDVTGGPRRSVLLLCHSDGGAMCSVNLDGAHRVGRYENTHDLPDKFLRDALDELTQRC